MYSKLNIFSSFFKVKSIDIYSSVFKLHGKITVSIFLLFSSLVSLYEYFGKPISCIVSDQSKKEILENICWVNGTYVLKYVKKTTIGVDVISYGVGGLDLQDSNRVYQYYYQYIVILLFVQAGLFYIPSYLWKRFEGGVLKSLCKNIEVTIHTDTDNEQKDKVINYLLSDSSAFHRVYAIRFFVCEFLNFLVVLFNIYLINVIFSGFWLRYSSAVWAIFTTNYHNWVEYSAIVFPKIVKCHVYFYGSSGSVQDMDALCLLAANVINDKIYAFIWIWMIVLFVMCSINLIYRFILLCSPNNRIQLIRSQAFSLSTEQIAQATKNGRIGEWFILYQMGRNMNKIIYREIIEELAQLRKSHTKSKRDYF